MNTVTLEFTAEGQTLLDQIVSKIGCVDESALCSFLHVVGAGF